MENQIQFMLSAGIQRLRRALISSAPKTQWSVQLTEDPEDNILNIFVAAERDRVRVREGLGLEQPDEETDSSETHKMPWLTIVIVEVVNAR